MKIWNHTVSNKMKRFSYKSRHGCCGRMYVPVSSHLKEEMAWDVDKQFWIIRTIDHRQSEYYNKDYILAVS